MKIAITLVAMLFLITVSCAAVTVQLTVFCNGGVVYDNAVTLDKPNPTALDAIKASGVAYTGYDSGWGYFLTSIAGCNGAWGPAFYVNGAESPVGVSSYYLSDGDQLQFIGPNSESHLAGYLYLVGVPSAVAKGQPFRIKVMEKSAYSWGGYDRPSAGAEVIVGNMTFHTGSDGYTDDIVLETDAYFCVAAEKPGYIATYYFYGLPYIQCGIGGPYICSITGEGVGRVANIEYDEYSTVTGTGFSSCRSYFAVPSGAYPQVSSANRQKGSGKYHSERTVRQRPGGIDINTSAEMKYEPTSQQLLSRRLNYASRYGERISHMNYRAAAAFEENYYNLETIKREGFYNNSEKINFSLRSDFEGEAFLHGWSTEKDAFLSRRRFASEEILDQYIGRFSILERGTFPIVNTTSSTGNDSDENESMEYELLPCCTGGLANTSIEISKNSAYSCFCRRNI